VVGERGSAERCEIEPHDLPPGRAERSGDPRGRIEFGAMALAVIDREAMTLEFFAAGEDERGGGIQSAGKQDDGATQWNLSR
jgi:hypothetical protein